MKFHKILIILLCISSLVCSKTILDKADALYEKGDYYLSLENYKTYKPKPNEKLELQKKIARCYYKLNKIDDAYKAFYDIKDSLSGLDIYMYATTLNMVGNYKEAMKWYYNVPKDLAEELKVKDKIMSCRWAIMTKSGSNIEIKPTTLADLGQSFGIQYYKNGVVYSYPEESSNKFKKDNHGLDFQNLFYSDLNENQIAKAKKKFSTNLVFPYHIGAITFSHNYTKIYYTKTVKLKHNQSVLKIFSASYDPKTNDWGNETELPFNSDDYSCAHPAVSPDNKYLYLTSNKEGGFGGKDLYRVEIKDMGTYGPMQNLGMNINTINDEMFPFIGTDNTLYFSSNGHPGYGGLDVFKATPTPNGWDNVINMMIPINSSYDDFAYIVNPNNKNTGFLSSDRNSKSDVIYAINTVEKAPLKLATVIENASEGYPIENTEVSLIDTETQEVVGNSVTDKYGAFEIPIPETYRNDNSKRLAVKISNDNYEDKVITVPAKRIQELNNKRIPIENVNQIYPSSFTATLQDVYDGTPIRNKEVLLSDTKSNYLIGKSISDTTGKIDITIPQQFRNADQNFDIKLPASDGYVSQDMTVSINELSLLNKKGVDVQPVNKKIPAIFSSKLEMEYTKAPLADAEVVMTDVNTGKVIGQAKTNNDGSFNIPIPTKYREPNNSFKITTKSIPGLLVEEMTMTISNIDEVAKKGIPVKNATRGETFTINSSVKDIKTDTPIKNANIIIKDKITGDIISRTFTDEKGNFIAAIPTSYKKDKRDIEIQTIAVPGYYDNNEPIAVDDVNKLSKGVKLQPKDNFTVNVSSKLTTTYNGGVIANANINIYDAESGEKLGSTQSKNDGTFEIYISDIYRGPKEFILEIKKGKEFEPKKIVSTIDDLENMRRDGIAMTPIFNDYTLDEINKMSIKHNRKAITTQGYTTLDKLAFLLKQNPTVIIKLNGQTDIRGERMENLRLSQQMAETAKNYLISKGVPAANIISRGYGDRYVINKCKRGVDCSLLEHDINNRVEVVVWKHLK